MTALWITLALVAGFVIGVVATSLAVMAGSKDKRDGREEMEFPCTIVRHRYGNCFGATNWLAFNLDYWDIPEEIEGGDCECYNFWVKADKSYIGFGQSPQECYEDLKKKLEIKKNEQRDKI